MSLPKEQKALLLESKQGSFVLNTVAVPQPGAGQVLVKIESVGLNPVDWKIQKYGAFIEKFPAIIGTDISGEVVEVGTGVSSLQKGDRVVFQGDWDNQLAGYQQYTLCDATLLAKISPNVSYDQAAALPVALTCAYVGLYNVNPYGIGLTPPVTAEGRGKYAGTPIVILGGGSSVGQYAIQLAKLSGFSPIITTASLKHTPFLNSLGATHVVDRNASFDSLQAEVLKATSLPIKYVYDAISVADTQNSGYKLLAQGGQLAITLLPTVELVEGKTVLRVLGIKKLPHNIKLLQDLYAKLTEFLQNEEIRPTQVEVIPNGLAGILDGLKKLEENKVSGFKLVVRPQETP